MARSFSRSPALLAAAKNGRLEYVKLLIKQHQADVNIEVASKSKDKNEQPRTPLVMAAQGGHLDVVKYLLAKGAHLNGCPISKLSSLRNVRRPLWVSVSGGHFDVAKYLIERGALVDIDMDGYQDLLSEAVKSNSYQMVNLVLDLQCFDVNSTNQLYVSQAMCQGLHESVKCLLDKGVDYRKRHDITGSFPLVCGAENQNNDSIESIKYLLDFIKAKEGHAAMIEYLNDNNNLEGRTALFEAIRLKHYREASILISYGANLNIKDNDGITPRDYLENPEELLLLAKELLKNDTIIAL